MKNRLRGLRKGKDLNQTQIAAVLRISQRGYSKYETGENKIPPEVLLRLADFYGVSVDYLLGRDETPAAQPPRGGSGRLQLAALRREHGMTQQRVALRQVRAGRTPPAAAFGGQAGGSLRRYPGPAGRPGVSAAPKLSLANRNAIPYTGTM